MDDIQVIAGRHRQKPVKRKHKHVQGRVEFGDFAQNGCFWLFAFACLATFILFMVLYWTVPVPRAPVSSFKRHLTVQNPRMASMLKKRTACLAGETFDTDLQMCGPTFYSPLAFDGSIMDTAQPSCESFYRSMCGRWIDQHTNENRAFSYGYHKNQERIKKLISSSSSSELSAFYASCMSIERNTKESILELKHTMESVVGDMRSHADLPTVFGRLARIGYTTPWTFSIERHPLEPRMIPLITFDSFPASLDEGRIYQILHNYKEVTNYNILEMQQRILSILKIMRALRTHNAEPIEAITNYVEYVSGTGFAHDLINFDAMTQDWNLKGHQPVRGWNNYFQALAGPALRLNKDQKVWVIGKTYMHWLLTVGLASFELSDWKAFIEFSIIYNGVQFEPDLPHDVYFKQHEKRGPLGQGGRFYQRVPRGNTTHVLTQQDRCIRSTQHMIPGIVAKTFLNMYMPDKEAIKQDVTKMVDRIRESFVERVHSTKWLSAVDKANITNKMRSTLVRVIEPDEWEEEPFAESLQADRYDHNMNLIRKYRVQRNLALWHSSIPNAFDRSAIAFFAMPLTETNAYYSGPTNTITILAGILQPPFYSPSYNQVTKHAILGSIIGHEMTHMLDNHGLYWDDAGSLRPKGWLTEAGMRSFYDKSDCVIIEYGPAPGGCEASNVAYGNATVGEDLADLTGISLAYDAYFKHTDEGRAAPLGDKQHFFMVLAQAFCESMDQEHRCAAVKEDEHAIAEFRIDRTFRNLPAFQTAFNCHEGQGMYKKTDDMCSVYGG